MEHILSPNHVDVLARFARARSIVAFDYDGTLSPIVTNRDRAFMRPHTRALLKALTQHYPCAIISGRGRDDVIAKLEGIDVKYVFGNHGLEPNEGLAFFANDIATISPELREALRGQEGVDIEDKRYSVSIHHRRAKEPAAAQIAIHEAIAKLSRPMRVVLGKLVVNVIPVNAPHKGDALVAIRAQEGADIALYVGDDVTDEDVFDLAQPEWLLCIRVGHTQNTAAPWYLRNQQEMDALLEQLLTLRH
jgi:trehalose 6-phosphate phosphatase